MRSYHMNFFKFSFLRNIKYRPERYKPFMYGVPSIFHSFPHLKASWREDIEHVKRQIPAHTYIFNGVFGSQCCDSLEQKIKVFKLWMKRLNYVEQERCSRELEEINEINNTIQISYIICLLEFNVWYRDPAVFVS